MAEVIAGKIAYDMKKDMDFEIASAGIYAIPGDSASIGAVKAMDSLGIDLNRHHARRLDGNIITNSDIILAMTGEHKSAIALMYPEAKDRLFTLKEYAAGTIGDIRDPYGQDTESYKLCAQELVELIILAVEKLCK